LSLLLDAGVGRFLVVANYLGGSTGGGGWASSRRKVRIDAGPARCHLGPDRDVRLGEVGIIVPARTARKCGRASLCVNTGALHTGQKLRCMVLPLSALHA
jgi:hypothetical protein